MCEGLNPVAGFEGVSSTPKNFNFSLQYLTFHAIKQEVQK